MTDDYIPDFAPETDVLKWAYMLLTPEELESIGKVFRRRLPPKMISKKGVSFKGTWWKRPPTLSYLAAMTRSSMQGKSVVLRAAYMPVAEPILSETLPEAVPLSAITSDDEDFEHPLFANADDMLMCLKDCPLSQHDMALFVLVASIGIGFKDIQCFVSAQLCEDGTPKFTFREKALDCMDYEDDDETESFVNKLVNRLDSEGSQANTTGKLDPMTCEEPMMLDLIFDAQENYLPKLDMPMDKKHQLIEILGWAIDVISPREREALTNWIRQAEERARKLDPECSSLPKLWWRFPMILAAIVDSTDTREAEPADAMVQNLIRDNYSICKHLDRNVLTEFLANDSAAAAENMRRALIERHVKDDTLARLILRITAVNRLPWLVRMLRVTHYEDAFYVDVNPEPICETSEQITAADIPSVLQVQSADATPTIDRNQDAKQSDQQPDATVAAESNLMNRDPQKAADAFKPVYRPIPDYEPIPFERVFSCDPLTPSIVEQKEGTVRYLGYVRAALNTSFFNFWPFAEWKGDRFVKLETAELVHLFPSRGAFNLYLEARRGPAEGALYVFDARPSDFVTNMDGLTGKPREDFRNRVFFDAVMKDGRFFPAVDIGIGLISYPDELQSNPDLRKPLYIRWTDDDDEGRIRIRPTSDAVHTFVTIDGLLYGPVLVKEDRNLRPYVDFSQLIRSSDGLMLARRPASNYLVDFTENIRTEDGSAEYVRLTYADSNNLGVVAVDAISDKQLLNEALKAVPSVKLPADATSEMLKSVETLVTTVPKIRTNRLRRLRSLLTTIALGETDRRYIGEYIVDRYKTDPSMQETVTEILAADERLVKKLASESFVGRALHAVKDETEKAEGLLAGFKQKVKEAEENLAAAHSRIEETDEEIRRQFEVLGLTADAPDKVAEIKRLETRIKELGADSEKLTALNDQLAGKLSELEAKAETFGENLLPEGLTETVRVWTAKHERDASARIAKQVNALNYDGPEGEALADMLLGRIQSVRRYDANTVLNLYLTYVQNFLTVLAGAPGAGKTSICGIMADSLGLNTVNDRIAEIDRRGRSLDRFVSVPVEYGWSTKRDFIGYRNPLTGRFESPDPARWSLIRQLDAEARTETGSVWPALMLLDEANLSPMEYYWSDWMRLCDGHANPGTVTLSEDGPTMVPDTLRFMATVNSDTTTEVLSPRLIDRAAVVTLPEPAEDSFAAAPESLDAGMLIPWKVLTDAFGARPVVRQSAEIHRQLTALAGFFADIGIRLSPRSRNQIEGYVGAASAVFKDEGRAPYIDAIDFAVMQKMLPKINGTGEVYRSELESLRDAFLERQLTRSAALLEGIIEDGSRAMDCYRFF